jgi:hypothetical protein
LGVKIPVLNFFDADPGDGIQYGDSSDPGWKKVGSGINIPDPQHCYIGTLRYFIFDLCAGTLPYFKLDGCIVQADGLSEEGGSDGGLLELVELSLYEPQH